MDTRNHLWHARRKKDLAQPFHLYLYVALVGGLFATSPFVFYQLWLFIAPGLYRKEKHYVVPFLLRASNKTSTIVLD